MLIGYKTKLQIRNNYCIVYTQADYDTHFSSHHNIHLQQNFKNMKTYSGTMTLHTKKRITRAIDMLLQLSPEMKKFNPVTNKIIKHRLSFITLTVHSPKKMLTAKEAYTTLLAPFLRGFRDKEIMSTYIWKAELQTRGQIHYHLTTPSIIPHDVIRKYWNKLQEKQGYLNDYYKEHNHYNPNSTDIHKVNHIKDFASYLAKEFCKSVQNESATTGKLWDCSLNIKGAKYFSTDLDNAIGRNILNAHKHGLLSELQLEKCTVLKLKHMKSYSLLTPVEKKSYNEYLKSLSNKTIKSKEPALSLNDPSINQLNTPKKDLVSNDIKTNKDFNKALEKNISKQQRLDIISAYERNRVLQKVKSKKPI